MQTGDDVYCGRLDNFLDRICAKIPSAGKAAELRAEMLDHVECKISFYMECGHDYDEAVKRAVAEMGDSKHIAEQMGSIHSRIPHLDMKNAINRIAMGLLIQFFSIDIGLLRSIMTIIGVLLVFSGMMQIRKANAKIRDAARMSFVQCGFQAAVFLFSAAPVLYVDERTSFFFGLIAGIIQIIFLSMLGRGLSDLVVRSSGDYISPEFAGIEIKIRRIGLLYLILFVMAWIGTLDQSMSTFMLVPFIILCIMILSRLLKTMRFLLIQQIGTNVEEIRKPVWIGLAFAGILVLILPWITTMFLYSIPNTFWQKSFYAQSEQIAGAAELIGQDSVDNITGIFNENGVNMEILQALPATEIAKLEGLVEIYSLIQSVFVQDGDLENHSLILVKADGSAEAIQWFKWLEAPANGSWDTVFLPRGQWHFSEEEPNSRVYIFNGDETNIQMQQPVRIRPGNLPRAVSGDHIYKEYDYFDYAVASEDGQSIMICSTVDDWLANNIFRFYESAVVNDSSLGGMFNYSSSAFSNQFPGCIYISRNKFKPHSYSTSLDLAYLGPIHANEAYGYTQSYVTNILETLDR